MSFHEVEDSLCGRLTLSFLEEEDSQSKIFYFEISKEEFTLKMEAIKEYLQSLLQNDIFIQSRLRIRDDTIVSIVSTCVMDEFDKISDDVSDDDKMYILRIVWIAARILMTNGGETISLFTPLNEYDSLFIDNDYYYIYRPAVLSMCSKMYYLCKAYNIDIPQYESVPLDFN